MNILVTGGAGYIGSHLCENLIVDNKVQSLDNYFTGSENNHISNVHYIKGNTYDIDKHIDFKPDLIFHLGEYSRVEQSFDDIKMMYDYNITSTFNVLEFARKHNCKLIYTGSSTKFSDNIVGTAQSPYSFTKKMNTELVMNYGNQFGLDYAITYFYNVYGGREIREGKYATLIGIFKNQMLENLPLTVVSPGDQKRNFTHIDDIIRGVALVGLEGHGDGYCIGSLEEYSILEIAKMFGGDIEMLPNRKGNRSVNYINIDKISTLGWTCKNSIKDHIKNFLENNS